MTEIQYPMEFPIEMEFKNETVKINDLEIIIVESPKGETEYWYIFSRLRYDLYAFELQKGWILYSTGDTDIVNFLNTIELYFSECIYKDKTSYKWLNISITEKVFPCR